MKTLRQRFEDNYMAAPVPAGNKRGFRIRYVYYKPWYVFDVSDRELRRARLRAAALLLASVLLFVPAGAVHTGVNMAAYVAVPATLSLCALLFVAIGVVQFCLLGRRITEQSYHDVSLKLGSVTLAHAGLLLLAVPASFYHMITDGFSTAGVLVALSFCLSAALSVLIRGQYRALPVRTEKNDALERYDTPPTTPTN